LFLDLRILKELWVRILELRIAKDLESAEVESRELTVDSWQSKEGFGLTQSSPSAPRAQRAEGRKKEKAPAAAGARWVRMAKRGACGGV